MSTQDSFLPFDEYANNQVTGDATTTHRAAQTARDSCASSPLRAARRRTSVPTGPIDVATDGSALGNPGPAGWAWYVDEQHWDYGGWKNATNNQGELTAVLQLLRATAHIPQVPLHIYCDSKYTIDSITSWMPGWKRRGWKKADGKPVLNKDIMQALDQAMQGRTVKFTWVRGHQGHRMNERADTLARAAANYYKKGTALPAAPGWENDTKGTR